MEEETLVRPDRQRTPSALRRAYLLVRSALLWGISLVHFALFVPPVVLMLRLLGRRFEPVLKFFSRSIVFLAGVRPRVRRAEGFDPERTCFFVSNHVNVFDPFIMHSTFPQFTRGLELESHFDIPFYGLLMKNVGNIPVPDAKTAAEVRRTFKLTKEALDKGISLIVFPEGSRTLTGHVGPFNDGVFAMARQFKCPIVPVSLVGSFEFHRKGDWMLRPSRVELHIHDTIDTSNLRKEDIPALRDRVRAIVSAPVEAAVEARGLGVNPDRGSGG